MRPLHSCAPKGWFPFLLMTLALALLLPVGCRKPAPPTVGSGYQDVPSFPWPPPKPSASVDFMKRSNLWLGPFQGLVSAMLGTFFVKGARGTEAG